MVDERLPKPPQRSDRLTIKERYARLPRYLRPVLRSVYPARPLDRGLRWPIGVWPPQVVRSGLRDGAPQGARGRSAQLGCDPLLGGVASVGPRTAVIERQPTSGVGSAGHRMSGGCASQQTAHPKAGVASAAAGSPSCLDGVPGGTPTAPRSPPDNPTPPPSAESSAHGGDHPVHRRPGTSSPRSELMIDWSDLAAPGSALASGELVRRSSGCGSRRAPSALPGCGRQGQEEWGRTCTMSGIRAAGGDAQGRLHPHFGWQASRVEGQRAALRRLGDLPHEGFAGRSGPAVRLAVECVVRAGCPPVR